ncbi:hypothetical protein ACFE04_021900 [Oxalis oulophora]
MDVWANIPTDILFSICHQLHGTDIIVVNSVCKSWRSSTTLLLQRTQIIPRSPLLMLAEKDKWGRSSNNNMRSFFDLSNGKTYDLNLPETINKKCLSVGFGWLLTIDIHLSMNLFHPLIGRKVSLPHYSTFKNYRRHRKIDGLKDILLWKAVASADPWNYKTQDFNQDCVIITTYEIGYPAIVKLGDKAWMDIQIHHRHYYDVVFYKSQIYTVFENFLYACNMNQNTIPSAYQVARHPAHLIDDYPHTYLVESVGELLIIFRHFEGDFYDSDLPEEALKRTMETPYVTRYFDVVKLVQKQKPNGEYDYEFVEQYIVDDHQPPPWQGPFDVLHLDAESIILLNSDQPMATIYIMITRLDCRRARKASAHGSLLPPMLSPYGTATDLRKYYDLQFVTSSLEKKAAVDQRLSFLGLGDKLCRRTTLLRIPQDSDFWKKKLENPSAALELGHPGTVRIAFLKSGFFSSSAKMVFCPVGCRSKFETFKLFGEEVYKKPFIIYGHPKAAKPFYVLSNDH